MVRVMHLQSQAVFALTYKTSRMIFSHRKYGFLGGNVPSIVDVSPWLKNGTVSHIVQNNYLLFSVILVTEI